MQVCFFCILGTITFYVCMYVCMYVLRSTQSNHTLTLTLHRLHAVRRCDPLLPMSARLSICVKLKFHEAVFLVASS